MADSSSLVAPESPSVGYRPASAPNSPAHHASRSKSIPFIDRVIDDDDHHQSRSPKSASGQRFGPTRPSLRRKGTSLPASGSVAAHPRFRKMFERLGYRAARILAVILAVAITTMDKKRLAPLSAAYGPYLGAC